MMFGGKPEQKAIPFRPELPSSFIPEERKQKGHVSRPSVDRTYSPTEELSAALGSSPPTGSLLARPSSAFKPNLRIKK